MKKMVKHFGLLGLSLLLALMLAMGCSSPKEESSYESGSMAEASSDESESSKVEELFGEASESEGSSETAESSGTEETSSGASETSEGSESTEVEESSEEGESSEGTESSEGEASSEEAESSETSSAEGAAEALVPSSDPVEASYFDDAVFVGDSITLELEYYVSEMGGLGNCYFLSAGSLGSGNALWSVSEESVHPTFWGVKMRIEDAIAQMDVSKVYIMLGMNDLGVYGIDGTLDNFKELISLIQAQSPQVSIYVQSVTPMTATSALTYADLNNEVIAAYNEKLLAACQENGWYYVNIAEVLTGEDGFLPREYSSDPDDMGIHFTPAACEMWIEYLYTHTGVTHTGVTQ